MANLKYVFKRLFHMNYGAMLKKISTMARTDCEKFMGTKVYLTTWVKVKENWRDSDFLVRNFGYSE